MGTNREFSITISYEITSNNEEWRNSMDYGVPEPAVTGGSITLPQGGSRASIAAVTGGIFKAGSEAATYAEENAKKIIDSMLPGEIGDRLMDVIDGVGNVEDIESFMTNIAKSQYMAIASEFSDNPDEAQATQQVIDSLQVKLTISNIPTKEEIQTWAMQIATEEISNALGGAAS